MVFVHATFSVLVRDARPAAESKVHFEPLIFKNIVQICRKSGSGRSDHHHFYLSEQCFGTISKKYRHCSEQYQRKTDIIPKLFDIVPKRLFTLFALFWAVILIFNRKKLSKFAENSLNSPKIRFAYYEKRIFKLSKR